MSRATFSAGAVVDIDGRTFELIRQISDSTWQLEDKRTKRIQEYGNTQLRGLYTAGQLSFVPKHGEAAAMLQRPLAQPDSAHLEKAKLKRLYVKAVKDLPISERLFKDAIERQWLQLKTPDEPPNWTTVYRWKKRFMKAGEDFLSLQDANHRKGNREARFPPEVTEFAEKAIDKIYLQRGRGTQQATLEHAAGLVLAENKLRPQIAQLPPPSRRLINRMICQLPAYDKTAARYGRVAATKRFRGVHGHRTTDAPLERAEIDHTQLDMMVIDDKSGLPLGRPWITACIDDHTRCVLGMHVSFEPPSHLTVAACLKQAFLPKTTLHADFPSIVNEWYPHGVMREISMDNGMEFHSLSLENACYSLGMEMHYSARKTPWFKGKIERFVGTANRAVAHGNPGTTFHNIFEKEEYDPSKTAVIRYSTLKELVLKWVVDVYHQKVHRSLDMPPAVMWANNIQADEIPVPADPTRLDAILGRSETRRLTHKGIELDGLLYNSPELTALRRRYGEAFDVGIRVDNADLGEIVVISPDEEQRLITVPALAADYARGLTEWQHRICKRHAAKERKSYSPDSWLEAKLYIANLIEQEFMHKKQSTRTRIARFNEVKNKSKTSVAIAEPKEPVVAVTAPEKSVPKAPPRPTPESALLLNAKGHKRFKATYRNRSAEDLAEDEGDSHD